MKIKKPLRYLLALSAFPLWFLLHVINENFWLIPLPVLLTEFLQYLLITFAIGGICFVLMKDRDKAFFFSFLLLSLYFLFGPLKDLIDESAWAKMIRPYSILLPLLTLLVIATVIAMRRSRRSFEKPVLFFLAFLLINLVVETGLIGFRILTGAKKNNDYGDADQSLIKRFAFSGAGHKPDVYWLLFDEYAASNSMEKVWGFKNPLDSALRTRNFYIADSASSNYNYTPYSLLSTLDMDYLRDYKEHKHVNAIDIAKSTYGMKETNVVTVFERSGYEIYNYSIYDFKGYPTKGDKFFDYLPRTLVTVRTLSGRTSKDIGWNFAGYLSGSRQQADSIQKLKALLRLDAENDALISRSFSAIRDSSSSKKPGFYLFHFQIPHEPYMYDSAGTVQYQQGVKHTGENYLKHLDYTNKVVVAFADSILKYAVNKNIVVIISGDHGFKFEESDPYFETESCRILYAVYCSDKDYSRWYRSISAVNSFRIVFNKYFEAKMPLLKDTSFNLLYRQK